MKKQKTISINKLKRLSFCNSSKLPKIIDHNGIRKEWVGIGWVEDGKATGNEVKVIEE